MSSFVRRPKASLRHERPTSRARLRLLRSALAALAPFTLSALLFACSSDSQTSAREAPASCPVCASSALDCTFTRTGEASRTGTGEIGGGDTAGCNGSLSSGNESVSFTLKCDEKKFCLKESGSSTEECFDATFGDNSFTYTIPADGKVNTCTAK